MDSDSDEEDAASAQLLSLLPDDAKNHQHASSEPEELLHLKSAGSAPVIRQLRAQGLSFQLWPAATSLVSLLDSSPSSLLLPSLPRPLRLLELGSGTGLVGLAAAALLTARVTITELPPARARPASSRPPARARCFWSGSSLMTTPKNSEEEAAPALSAVGSPRSPATVNWGTATVMGVFAGLLYGGSKEASASISKDAEAMLKLGSTPDKREQYRIMRDAMEKRFIRVARGSLVGGIRLGMFTAVFYGLQDLLADKRGVHDVYNVAGAGSATAAMFGLILPGSMMWRVRNVLLGSVLGAGICFPLGWLQLKLMEKANKEISYSKPLSDPTEEELSNSRVGAAIERLEGSLQK